MSSVKSVELDSAVLANVLDQAMGDGMGFADDAFDPSALIDCVDTLPYDGRQDGWQIIRGVGQLPVVHTVQLQILEVTTQITPESNLDFVHVKHRDSKGWQGVHVDVCPVDISLAGYVKGRFRVGLNLDQGGLFKYINPEGVRKDHVVRPGTFYAMDYSYNPRHGIEATTHEGTLLQSGRVLLMTDVERYAKDSGYAIGQ